MSCRGPFILLSYSLISFKVMGNVLDGFFLINLGSIPVTLRVGIGLLLMEVVAKTVGKGDTKLLQKGVGVAILSYCVLLSLTELTFASKISLSFSFKYIFQCLYLHLRLLQQLLF